MASTAKINLCVFRIDSNIDNCNNVQTPLYPICLIDSLVISVSCYNIVCITINSQLILCVILILCRAQYKYIFCSASLCAGVPSILQINYNGTSFILYRISLGFITWGSASGYMVCSLLIVIDSYIIVKI